MAEGRPFPYLHDTKNGGVGFGVVHCIARGGVGRARPVAFLPNSVAISPASPLRAAPSPDSPRAFTIPSRPPSLSTFTFPSEQMHEESLSRRRGPRCRAGSNRGSPFMFQ